MVIGLSLSITCLLSNNGFAQEKQNQKAAIKTQIDSERSELFKLDQELRILDLAFKNAKKGENDYKVFLPQEQLENLRNLSIGTTAVATIASGIFAKKGKTFKKILSLIVAGSSVGLAVQSELSRHDLGDANKLVLLSVETEEMKSIHADILETRRNIRTSYRRLEALSETLRNQEDAERAVAALKETPSAEDTKHVQEAKQEIYQRDQNPQKQGMRINH